MNAFEEVITIIDMVLNTKRKKHIVGGMLISLSVLFGGLAITTLTLKMEEDNDELQQY